MIQVFRRLEGATKEIMYVDPSTTPLRPYVVCAVLRGLNFDKRNYKSFIELQEKLHQNICRRRTYVAIGTHDLDTLKGPFRYSAKAPTDIQFVPLTEDHGRSYNGKELMDFYREDPSAKHLKPYTDIIYDSPVYPVIHDSTGMVLSLPPIINGKHSRIQLHTKNVFIECTGTDITKANIVLDTVIAMFSQYCTDPFTAEAVDVIYEMGDPKNNTTHVTPLLSQRTCEATVKEINGTIGIDITAEKICSLCDRMQLGPAVYIPERDAVQVTFLLYPFLITTTITTKTLDPHIVHYTTLSPYPAPSPSLITSCYSSDVTGTRPTYPQRHPPRCRRHRRCCYRLWLQ